MATALSDPESAEQGAQWLQVFETGDGEGGSGFVEFGGGGAAGCYAQDANTGRAAGGDVGFGETGWWCGVRRGRRGPRRIRWIAAAAVWTCHMPALSGYPPFVVLAQSLQLRANRTSPPSTWWSIPG